MMICCNKHREPTVHILIAGRSREGHFAPSSLMYCLCTGSTTVRRYTIITNIPTYIRCLLLWYCRALILTTRCPNVTLAPGTCQKVLVPMSYIYCQYSALSTVVVLHYCTGINHPRKQDLHRASRNNLTLPPPPPPQVCS